MGVIVYCISKVLYSIRSVLLYIFLPLIVLIVSFGHADCVQVFSECTRMYNFTQFSDTLCTKCTKCT